MDRSDFFFPIGFFWLNGTKQKQALQRQVCATAKALSNCKERVISAR